jgi:hypothetical protein
VEAGDVADQARSTGSGPRWVGFRARRVGWAGAAADRGNRRQQRRAQSTLSLPASTIFMTSAWPVGTWAGDLTWGCRALLELRGLPLPWTMATRARVGKRAVRSGRLAPEAMSSRRRL